METTNEILKQLKRIGETNRWDTIEIVAYLDGHPVYELRNSKIPNGAKTGRPHLYSTTTNGIVFELDSSQIHNVIVSYNGLRQRLQ